MQSIRNQQNVVMTLNNVLTYDTKHFTIHHLAFPLSHLAWCYSCTFLSSYIGNISASFASDVLFISFVCKLWYFKIFQCSVFKVQYTDFHPCDWAWEDSNFRPHAYQACALTGWATSPKRYLSLYISSLLWPSCNLLQNSWYRFFHDFTRPSQKALFFRNPAATCSPTPSPVQYHRPLKS